MNYGSLISPHGEQWPTTCTIEVKSSLRCYFTTRTPRMLLSHSFHDFYRGNGWYFHSLFQLCSSTRCIPCVTLNTTNAFQSMGVLNSLTRKPTKRCFFSPRVNVISRCPRYDKGEDVTFLWWAIFYSFCAKKRPLVFYTFHVQFGLSLMLLSNN